MKIPHRQRMGDRNAPKTRRMMGRTGRLGGFPGDFPAGGLAGRPLRAMRAPFMRDAALFIRQRGIFLFATRHATSLLRPPARGRSRLLVATDWLKGFLHPFGASLFSPIRRSGGNAQKGGRARPPPFFMLRFRYCFANRRVRIAPAGSVRCSR